MFSEKYLIHWGEECAWAVAVGVVGYVGTELAATSLDTLDLKAFAVSVAVGAGRVALAVLANQVRKFFASP